MSEPNFVTAETRGRHVVLWLDNPPVNALGHGLRAALLDALEAADADGAVEGIVLAGRGKAFIAGADIREFGKPPQDPWLPELLMRLEALETPVVAAAKAAMADPGELDLAQHALRLAAEAGEQAGSIAESILDLADRSDAPTSCSVRAAADRAVRLASGKTQRGRHSIALRLPHDLIAPIAERDLAQVLLNLILNACNAMPGGGRVTITTPGEGECSTWNTDDASPAVRVLVRDQGLGMDQGRLDKARRALGEGSAGTPGRAVGLSVCGEIVGRVGGRVDIEAEPGMGTTAILVFPSKPNEARKAA